MKKDGRIERLKASSAQLSASAERLARELKFPLSGEEEEIEQLELGTALVHEVKARRRDIPPR